MFRPPPPASSVAVGEKKKSESLGLNITFAVFGCLAFILLIGVTVVAVTDYINTWSKKPADERIVLPIISDYINEQETVVSAPEAEASASPAAKAPAADAENSAE